MQWALESVYSPKLKNPKGEMDALESRKEARRKLRDKKADFTQMRSDVKTGKGIHGEGEKIEELPLRRSFDFNSAAEVLKGNG